MSRRNPHGKTVETVARDLRCALVTGLKPGVNEKELVKLKPVFVPIG